MAARKVDLPAPIPPFDVQASLDSAGVSRRIVRFTRGTVVFAQGDQANHVSYIQYNGGLTINSSLLSVVLHD
ncbi:MAG: hypothetical protein ACRD3C_04810 [Vicinamibacterales bacterium]